MPRLNGRRSTCTPRARATSAVRSLEPSSTTTISRPSSYARIPSITLPTAPSSLKAGTIAIRRRSPTADGDGLDDPRQLEHLPGAVCVRVLVEHPLARPPPHFFGLRWIGAQLAIRVDRLFRVLDDEQLAAGLEPALDPLDGVRDDRRAGGGELEGTRGGRGGDARMGAARDVQVDTRRRDRTREDVERDVADQPRVADVAAEVAAAEREVELRRETRGLADERLHPLAAELVAVAVEEDVVLLGDLVRT